MAVTNDLTLIHACNAVTDGTTSHVLSSTGGGAIKTLAADEISPREGTGCYGVDLDVETLYFQIAHASTSWNLTNCAIYAWFAFYTSTYLDTWQNGGVTCRLLDASSNYSEWYLGGSDSVGSAWQRLCLWHLDVYNHLTWLYAQGHGAQCQPAWENLSLCGRASLSSWTSGSAAARELEEDVRAVCARRAAQRRAEARGHPARRTAPPPEVFARWAPRTPEERLTHWTPAPAEPAAR